MKVISIHELKQIKGIPYHPQHVRKLTKEGTFPPPIKIGENRNAFIDSEIDLLLEAAVANRDGTVDKFLAARKAARGSVEPWLSKYVEKMKARGKLEKADLLKNKYGKIVSKKKSELAKKKDTVSRLKQFRFKTKE